MKGPNSFGYRGIKTKSHLTLFFEKTPGCSSVPCVEKRFDVEFRRFRPILVLDGVFRSGRCSRQASTRLEFTACGGLFGPRRVRLVQRKELWGHESCQKRLSDVERVDKTRSKSFSGRKSDQVELNFDSEMGPELDTKTAGCTAHTVYQEFGQILAKQSFDFDKLFSLKKD